MYNKKIICLEDSRIIAVKYCDDQKLCVIGGSEVMREMFEAVLKEYFGFTEATMPQFRITTKAKGRFVFDCTWERYLQVIEDLRKNNITVRDVRTHGKLMR